MIETHWIIKLQRIGLSFILVLFTLGINFGAFASEQELLKSHDVTKIMQQIFEQHLGSKEMNDTILKHSFKLYLDQFDPERMYLLQIEVDPFLNPTDAQMKEYMEDYQKEDFTPYKKMDLVIQKSILRSRQWRQEWELKQEILFQEARHATIPRPVEDEKQQPYASTIDDLKVRIQEGLFNFIHYQIHQFGEATVQQREPQLLSHYEAELRAKRGSIPLY